MATIWAQGQGEAHGKGRIQHLVTFLTDTLRLTSDQQKAVEKILLVHWEKAKAIRHSMADPKERRKALGALRQDTDGQIAALLDPAQKATWEAIKADWRQRARRSYQQRMGQPAPLDED